MFRIGRASATTLPQLLIAITAAAPLAFSPLGIAAVLALAAGVGLWLFQSPRVGAVLLLGLTALVTLVHMALWFPSFLLTPGGQATDSAYPAGLTDLAMFFFKVGG